MGWVGVGFGGRWIGLGGGEGRGANSKRWFTTSFLQGGRCRKAMLGVWVRRRGNWKRKENRTYLGDVGPHDARPEPLSSEPVKPSARVRVAAEVRSCADGCD